MSQVMKLTKTNMLLYTIAIAISLKNDKTGKEKEEEVKLA